MVFLENCFDRILNNLHNLTWRDIMPHMAASNIRIVNLFYRPCEPSGPWVTRSLMHESRQLRALLCRFSLGESGPSGE